MTEKKPDHDLFKRSGHAVKALEKEARRRKRVEQRAEWKRKNLEGRR